jgi:hypothetical protein
MIRKRSGQTDGQTDGHVRHTIIRPVINLLVFQRAITPLKVGDQYSPCKYADLNLLSFFGPSFIFNKNSLKALGGIAETKLREQIDKSSRA